MNYYSEKDLQMIVKRTSSIFNYSIDEESSFEIARRSRGTPRVANRLFRRVRDFAQFLDEESKTAGDKDSLYSRKIKGVAPLQIPAF